MSRSHYSDDADDFLEMGRWRGRVASATRGKRGQAFFRDLVKALDAMPEKRLIEGALVITTDTPRREDIYREGEVCAFGAVAIARGMTKEAMQAVDVEDHDAMSALFGIAAPLCAEVMYMNDEAFNYATTPEERWVAMRDWAAEQIILADDEVLPLPAVAAP